MKKWCFEQVGLPATKAKGFEVFFWGGSPNRLYVTATGNFEDEKGKDSRQRGVVVQNKYKRESSFTHFFHFHFMFLHKVSDPLPTEMYISLTNLG